MPLPAIMCADPLVLPLPSSRAFTQIEIEFEIRVQQF